MGDKNAELTDEESEINWELLKKCRKRPVGLDQKALEKCLAMYGLGCSIKQIADFSGQTTRNIQRLVARYTKTKFSGQDGRLLLKKRGPKPFDDERLMEEIKRILGEDNSLTRKGYFFTFFT